MHILNEYCSYASWMQSEWKSNIETTAHHSSTTETTYYIEPVKPECEEFKCELINYVHVATFHHLQLNPI